LSAAKDLAADEVGANSRAEARPSPRWGWHGVSCATSAA